MLRPLRLDVRTRISRKLLLAVGLPTLVLAVAGLVWLGATTHARVWAPVTGFVLLTALSLVAIHFVAVRTLLVAPLSRMVTTLRGAEAGDFLLRLPVETDDELGELARSFNAAFAAITDLHARRIEDARELELKAELEAQHRLLDEAHRRLQRRVQELTLLSELARTLGATLRLDELLAAVADHLGRSLGYESFAILLLDEESGALEVRGVHGIETSVKGSRVGLGEGVAGIAARERRRMLVKDTRADARFPAQRWTAGKQGSVLAVPLVARDACVGVLDFFRSTVDGFPEEEMSFLDSVASQVALAVANARLHERTVRLSLTDALTGLHNRRSFAQRLAMELDRSERFAHPAAVVMIDVDHFKRLNDRAGHLAGDAALRAFAVLLGGAVRKVDTLARLGGEEFAVLLPRADAAAALEVAEKLRRQVAEAGLDAGAPGERLTISAGVAAYPEHARDLDALLDCADAALYAAKRAGRDRVVAYAPGMREEPGRPARIDAAAEALG